MDDNQIETALEWVKQGRDVVLCTVIETWGSSPRPVGSQLVVNDAEVFQGSVSGGCIESTVVSEAQFAIHADTPQRLSIGINDKQTWDFGLACGGSIEIYIEPVRIWQDTLVELVKLIKNQTPCCLVTNLTTGAKTLIHSDLHNVSPEFDIEILSSVENVMDTGHSCIVKKDREEFFLHGFLPSQQLIIGGAVHVTQPLVQMAESLGYKCSIIDPRTAFATQIRFPKSNLIVEHPKKVLKKIQLHSGCAIVALSHSPQFDDPLLIAALNSNACYIGAMGSKKTHADRIERLQKYGFSSLQLKRIHGPIGLDLGCKTIAEIALSIMAEIIHEKRNAGSEPFKKM